VLLERVAVFHHDFPNFPEADVTLSLYIDLKSVRIGAFPVNRKGLFLLRRTVTCELSSRWPFVLDLE